MSWNEKNLRIHTAARTKDAVISILEDAASILCREEMQLLVSPARLTLDAARAFCVVHGGRIVAPRSMEENDEVMGLIAKHHNATCLNEDVKNMQNKGRALWLGLKKVDSRLVALLIGNILTIPKCY